jgi:hypothetical protein
MPTALTKPKSQCVCVQGAIDIEKFCHDAVDFVNDRCFGNLSISLVIDPPTQKSNETVFQSTLRTCAIGSIVVNGPALRFAVTFASRKAPGLVLAHRRIWPVVMP